MDVSVARPEKAGDLVVDSIVALVKKTGRPDGLEAFRLVPEDGDQLLAGMLPRHRVTCRDFLAKLRLFMDDRPVKDRLPEVEQRKL